jgi:hypothetical protein
MRRELDREDKIHSLLGADFSSRGGWGWGSEERERETGRDREREREVRRQRERQRERETEKERDRERDREREMTKERVTEEETFHFQCIDFDGNRINTSSGGRQRRVDPGDNRSAEQVKREKRECCALHL